MPKKNVSFVKVSFPLLPAHFRIFVPSIQNEVPLNRTVILIVIFLVVLLFLGKSIDQLFGVSPGTFAGYLGGLILITGWICAMIYLFIRKKKRQAYMDSLPYGGDSSSFQDSNSVNGFDGGGDFGSGGE